MSQDLGKRANVLGWPVAVLGRWHCVRRLLNLVLHIAAKNGYRRRQRIRRRGRIRQVLTYLGVRQGRQDGNGYHANRNHDASDGSEHLEILQHVVDHANPEPRILPRHSHRRISTGTHSSDLPHFYSLYYRMFSSFWQRELSTCRKKRHEMGQVSAVRRPSVTSRQTPINAALCRTQRTPGAPVV